MIMKIVVLAEPVMAGLEEAVGGSEVYPDCLPCASELILRRQSCSAPKLVCKDKCLKAAAYIVVVEPRVPERSLAEPRRKVVRITQLVSGCLAAESKFDKRA